jgi:hypothetical protein
MVKEQDPFSLIRRHGPMRWTIMCIEGELFEDEERFSTWREAKRRIMELLA